MRDDCADGLLQGFVGRELGQPGLKPTVRVGEAALREVAAFLLDHDNFAKVQYPLSTNVDVAGMWRSKSLRPRSMLA